MIQKEIELGPIHTWLPYAMKLKLGMCGDRIVKVGTEFGFLKREIEEKMIGLGYKEAQLIFGRIDPESSLILDRLFSEAVERVTQTEVSDRAHWIREITSILSELNSCLKYQAQMADRMGLKFLANIILKHREHLLDLIELLTGSRYGYYFLVPGGARYDLTEGFQERVERWVKTFRQDFERIRSMFLWTHPLQNRLRSLGKVVDNGDYGFVSESSVETTRYGLVSHVESRLICALTLSESLSSEIEAKMSERFTGNFIAPLTEKRGQEEIGIQHETARGTWGLLIKFDSALKVKKVMTTTPSQVIRQAIGPALEEESLEDVPLILQSLNLSVPEIDR